MSGKDEGNGENELNPPSDNRKASFASAVQSPDAILLDGVYNRLEKLPAKAN